MFEGRTKWVQLNCRNVPAASGTFLMATTFNDSPSQNGGLSPRPVTLVELAKRVGLSKTTVSDALRGNGRLNDETRRMIQETAREIGYLADPFAQGLRQRENDLIAFFSPDLDLSSGTLKTQAIAQRLFARGYTVPIYAYGTRKGGASLEQEELFTRLRRQRPRAVVCNSSNLKSPRAQEELRCYVQDGGIAVCYDWPLDVSCDAVVFDAEQQTYLAAHHLIEKGHRDIGFYVAQDRSTYALRLKGFRHALEEAGLRVQAQWLAPGFFQIENEREGIALAAWFLAQSKRPSAMCVVNDAAAAARLMRAGVRIPDDLSLIGHDNSAIADACILPLTTVSHPIDEIAERVVELLDSRLNGRYDGPPRREIVQSELIERESVQACRNVPA